MVSLTNLTEIGHTYQHTPAHVTSLYGVKDDFEIQAAVLWGDTLGPFLFTVELDYILGKALQGHDERLWQPQQCRRTISSVEASVLKFGLGMNAKKTKAMV
jgi:hypothetical protein